MKIETITNEPRRGCGFRKEGGLYLMGGTSLQSCGKLPIPLEICPVCGQGIKPSRSWTWINGAELIEDVECTYFHGNIMPDPHRMRREGNITGPASQHT